ncbi:MAG: glycosyltransferase, partial [Lachnospiraceae bacterium]|nr:glycosyltransferase [Lachnospiraceae bacterium]
MNGLVSIIVPIYRAEAYIADTIEMVARQTYTEWELLLVDDCSPDGSAQVVRDTLREHKWNLRSSGQQDDKETEEVRPTGNEGIRAVEEYTDDKGRQILLISKERNEGAAAARNTGL